MNKVPSTEAEYSGPCDLRRLNFMTSFYFKTTYQGHHHHISIEILLHFKITFNSGPHFLAEWIWRDRCILVWTCQ